MTQTLERSAQTHPPPPAPSHHERGLGLVYGVAAYGFWGIVPVYFKWIAHVPPVAVLAHRICWSSVFVVLVVSLQSRWREVKACLRSRVTMLMLLASTVMIAINWFSFIWSVSNNQLLQASLGYFINPLLAVLLGVVILGERLRIAQAAAVILAFAAVVAMIYLEGRVPVVAMSVAGSFAMYGLLRKQAVVAPIIGLLIETILLLPLSIVVVARQVQHDTVDHKTWALLAASGVITAVPLIWFAAAARRLRLATMGFLQYLSPTGQFLLGRFLYHEPLNAKKLSCFSLIWMALLIFTIDSVIAYRRSRQAAPAPIALPE